MRIILGGLSVIHEKGIKSYANQMTIDLAKTHQLPVPQYGFADSLNINLGEKQILFPACMVKEMRAGNLGNMEGRN